MGSAARPAQREWREREREGREGGEGERRTAGQAAHNEHGDVADEHAHEGVGADQRLAPAVDPIRSSLIFSVITQIMCSAKDKAHLAAAGELVQPVRDRHRCRPLWGPAYALGCRVQLPLLPERALYTSTTSTAVGCLNCQLPELPQLPRPDCYLLACLVHCHAGTQPSLQQTPTGKGACAGRTQKTVRRNCHATSRETAGRARQAIWRFQ